MRRLPSFALVLGLALPVLAVSPAAPALTCCREALHPSPSEIRTAFAREGIRLTLAEAEDIGDDVALALDEARRHGAGNSKVGFAAVEIANLLGLDTSSGSNGVRQVAAAIRRLDGGPVRQPSPSPPPQWGAYFDRTLDLWNDRSFMRLVGRKGFSPVKISWEDIGRHANSVWGDRISDVGIWVRRDEEDLSSARLALSVRRDGNFRDKVLVVPAEAIKVHQRLDGRTVEKTLPQRLAELGLASRRRDRNVIVSNQFAIVPVPARSMRGAWPPGVPPRAAFNFSIFPYGSTNLVITDVIEGSHEAVVGPGQHQLLYANIDGDKAPFTASRAEDRPDLLRLERQLRARGMDVDVQRYYLIQVPLVREARVRPAHLGTPPWARHPFQASTYEGEATLGAGVAQPSAAPPATTSETQDAVADQAEAKGETARRGRRDQGLTRVAIGHGESEGRYDAGGDWRGARADEPIRVTVVYFVTPVGEVTRRDMESFTRAFESWDAQALWGGSFVTNASD